MITLATYNILHGHFKDQILANIKNLFEKGADIICLQEADMPFETPLNQFLLKYPNWSVMYIHNGKGCNLATLWNTAKLTLKSSETLFLPKPSEECFQRGALISTFMLEGVTVRVSNVHLSWEGGLSHRFTQLQFLKEHLSKSYSDSEVICGDFNTFAPAVFRNYQKNKAGKILGSEWKNALPELVWSCDVSHSYERDNFHLISVTLKSLGCKLRSCLDYIFTKNLSVINGQMLDLPGSDHRPLIVQVDMI